MVLAAASARAVSKPLRVLVLPISVAARRVAIFVSCMQSVGESEYKCMSA